MKRAPVAHLAAGDLTLSPETSRHLCLVLRMRVGESFLAFDPVTRHEAECTLLVASESAATVRASALRPAELVAEHPLHLIYALAKGDKVDAVVRDATELGATRITIARTSRSVVKIDERAAPAKLERWTRVALEAARQCGRADPPPVTLREWTDALDEASTELRFVLDVHAADPLGPLLSSSAITFAVGAEGGLTEEEVASAAKRGFHPVNIGRFVLRTETVAAAVLGAVRILRF